ncbi:MAG: YlbF family regulator [Ignavibacteriaceae bacterium]
MNNQIKSIADQFVNRLFAVPEVIEYNETLGKYENNEEIKSLTGRYNSLAVDFQKKQYDGSLTQEEINEMRSIVSKLRSHPLENEIQNKQSELVGVLHECNDEISSVINMDFAKIAAPSSGCCS